MSAACPACDSKHRAGAKFCSECGAALARCCPACGEPVGVAAKFCADCGASLGPAETAFAASGSAPALSPPEGERKQVTVLFADVARSMDLAESLDPDEWAQIMEGLVALCREAVEHVGGTVDKFTGDGVMALFGAPVAQEDHARRACLAALRLVADARGYAEGVRARHRLELGVRVGLNSGEVVAGAVGGAGYTAIGHTVGLAQRMEGLAEVGTVNLSAYTAALVAGQFPVLDRGEMTVKGAQDPLRVFVLQDGPGVAPRPAGSTRLVGRDEELATLQAALDRARHGNAQVVGLVGEAGAGKSRLCEELASYAETSGFVVRRTAGVSHAREVALLPIVGLFRNYFLVTSEDTAAQVRAKVATRVLALDPGLEPELALVFDFLAVPDPAIPVPQLGADARRRRMLDVLRRVTQKRSQEQAVLFLLEDLHLFDAESVAFLHAWLPSFPGSRTMLVVNFRPEFVAPWTNHSYYRQLPLAPLDDRAVGELIAARLGPGPEMATLTEALCVRAGGNPFFAEELVRGLVDGGFVRGEPGAYALTRPLEDLRVPPTVQAVLAARIDRLGSREKAILQAAAVIGRVFSEAVLLHVSGLSDVELLDGLHALRAAELVQETETPGEYRFWHPLTQEVAYGTLLGAARRRVHHAVALAVPGSDPSREEENAALVARHFEAAGEPLEAARWQLRAGIRAMYGNFDEAMRQFRSVIDHLRGLPETEDVLALGVRARTLLLRLGARTGMDSAETEQLFAEARPVAQRLQEPGLLSGLSIADGVARVMGGDGTGSVASYREACRYSDQIGEPGLRAPARFGMCLALSYTGPPGAGLALLEELFALCEGDVRTGMAQFGYSVHDSAVFMQSMLLMSAGRLVEARQKVEHADALFQKRPVAEWQSWNLAQRAYLADLTGNQNDLDKAATAARQAHALATDSGNLTAAIRARQALGVVLLLRGSADEAATVFTDALAQARKHRSGLQEESSLLAHLARTHLALADAESARAAADEAVAVADRQGARVYGCLTRAVHARVLRKTAAQAADLDAARAAVATGSAIAAEIGARTYTAFLAEQGARLSEDPRQLERAAGEYDAIGATGHVARLAAGLAAG
ncbi:MAG: ATP-binding protein [Sporichthyaceae bacterium]